MTWRFRLWERLSIRPCKRQGINLVEIIMATTLFSIVIFSFIIAISYGLESIYFAGDRAKATFLAEEGVEVARNIRDSDFANLVDGTYGVDTVSSAWDLSGSSDSVDGFTREVILDQISADVFDVQSRVTWDITGLRPGEIVLNSKLTNWMKVVDTGIGDWSSPVLTSSYSLFSSGDGWKVDVQGDYAYIVRYSGSLDFVIVDISDLSNPLVVSYTSVLGNLRDIEVSGNYAYIASSDNSREVLVYDISFPLLPLLIDTVNLSGSNDGYTLQLVDDVLFVARSGGTDQFVALDVSNPYSVSVLDATNLPSNSLDMYVDGGFAFVGGNDNSQDLVIVNVSNLNNIFLTATANISGSADISAVTGFDDYLILGRSDGGILIYNKSNPYNPTFVSSISAGNNVNDMVLGNDNKYLFVGTDENSMELQIFDISNINAPFLLGYYDTGEDMNGVDYSPELDRFFAVGDDNGDEFVILEPS